MKGTGQEIDRLLSYCSDREVEISPALYSKSDIQSGIGIHTVRSIKKGQRIIHAPTKALLTTEDIPSEFLPSSHVRENLTVHGLLAAWLAFGHAEVLEERYGPWMDMWPTWSSFRDSMPVFWMPQFLQIDDITPRQHSSEPAKRRRVANGTEKPVVQNKNEMSTRRFSLSAATDGWLPPHPVPNHKTLRDQIAKLHNILVLLHDCKDLLGFDVLSEQSRQRYARFLHMWSCVNTRCFYYVAHGTKAPKDPNEAMALVPFLDLFNHTTDGSGAEVKFDEHGFTVFADRDYEMGEEVFVQYGSHPNDALWIEYGFLLDNNAFDEVDLDQIILANLGVEQKEILAAENYLGEYTFSAAEISHRMEVVAWLASGALEHSEWQAMVQGVYDPEDEEADKYGRLKMCMNNKIIDWLVIARGSCQKNIENLWPMQDDVSKHTEVLTPSTDHFSINDATSRSEIVSISSGRLQLCLRRWKQIHGMCSSAIQMIADEHPTTVSQNWSRTAQYQV